ncbi:MAG: hypothetical protein GF350_16250 [Chitinivibrionales bacterium]|nr:hypothetical protein [Chitinivibrionales bacterium]
MHIFDILVLIIAALFIIFGIRRGLIGEAVRLVALVAGFAVATAGYRSFYTTLDFIPFSDSAKLVCAFLILFFATLLVVFTLGWIIRKIIRLTVLGWVDRISGGCIGLIKAFIVTWIFVLSVSSSPFAQIKKRLDGSTTYSLLEKFPPQLSVPYIETTKKSLEKFIDGTPMKTIRNVQHKVDSFRTKVDSAMGRNAGEKTMGQEHKDDEKKEDEEQVR